MRRTGICGAAETLLIDSGAIGTMLVPILDALKAAGCEIRASATVLKDRGGPDRGGGGRLAHRISRPPSFRSPWWMASRGAISHINRYSSHHTEAVVAEDPGVVERFFTEIDSAILLHNASTQFADGGEFGMGAEIGIATGKMHARGPVGVEQLTSFKYRVRGTGQTRA